VVGDGDLTEKQRNGLLREMTDEVGRLVLYDNYDQNIALAEAVAQALPLAHVHEDWMKRLEKAGLLDRELEFLPSSKQMMQRRSEGIGLTQPELSVLLAYTKIVLAEEVLDSDLPDDPFLRSQLFRYFPSAMQHGYRRQMDSHPLRREIVATQIVNDTVNTAGITFFHRITQETGATAEELLRAHLVVREIFATDAFLEQITALDNKVPAQLQTRMRLQVRTLLERGSRWMVTNRRHPLDSEATVEFFGTDVQSVMAALPDILTGGEYELLDERRKQLLDAQVPDDLAVAVATMPPAYALLGVVETARRDKIEPLEVARVHFAVGEKLGIGALLQRILALPREDRWQTMARAALRDDLHAVHTQITAQVLAHTDGEDDPEQRIKHWSESEGVVLGRASSTLEEIWADETPDLARLSVGLRVVRTLLSAQ
jgi:glutamate dehydrogenase